ncbi:WXG100 family type VII secretion target, partial [Streptomyces mirabilis]|uniref:WXG100 family type VII secretion target n=1 Tax=Streptomyces mirabilis TaxID=68239 RepID=UPI003650B015
MPDTTNPTLSSGSKGDLHSGFYRGDGHEILSDPNAMGSVAYSDVLFSGWSWQELEAAILGGAGTLPGQMVGASDEFNRNAATSVSDPATLERAAQSFQLVLRTLVTVNENMASQVNALVGEGGSWKGPAATAYANFMSSFGKEITAISDAMGGGGGVALPQSVADNTHSLGNAIMLATAIDRFYGQQIADTVNSVSNARMTVGAWNTMHLVLDAYYKKVEEAMKNDLVQLLQNLAGHYMVTVSGAVTPPELTNPFGADTGQGVPGVDAGLGGIPAGDAGGSLAGPGAGGAGGADALGASPGLAGPDVSSSGLGGGGLGGGAGGAGLDAGGAGGAGGMPAGMA